MKYFGLVLIVIVFIVAFAWQTNDWESNPQNYSRTYSDPSTEEVEFNTGLSLGHRAYADIVSSTPKFFFQDLKRVAHSTIRDEQYIICLCKQTSGTSIYVVFDINDYKQWIDSNANRYMSETKTFSSKRIHGSVSKGEKFGQEMSGKVVLCVSSIT